MKVFFDGKPQFTFKNYDAASPSGSVQTEVCKAVRMPPTTISAFKLVCLNWWLLQNEVNDVGILICSNLQADSAYAKDRGYRVNENTFLVQALRENDYSTVCFPKLRDCQVNGSITYIENCDEFYLQPENEYNNTTRIGNRINAARTVLESFKSINDIGIGLILAAPYQESNSPQPAYYRAKVLSIPGSDTQEPEVEVRYCEWVVYFSR